MKTEREHASNFARNLSRQIELSGLSKSQLGKLVGASRATVSDWTNGKIQPRLTTFFRICEALDCEPNVLAGFSSSATPKMVDAYLDAPRPIQEAVDGLLAPYKKGTAVG